MEAVLMHASKLCVGVYIYIYIYAGERLRVCLALFKHVDASVTALVSRLCLPQTDYPSANSHFRNKFFPLRLCRVAGSQKPLTASFKWHRWMVGFTWKMQHRYALTTLSCSLSHFKYDTHTEHQSSSGSLSITCDDFLPTCALCSEYICRLLSLRTSPGSNYY